MEKKRVLKCLSASEKLKLIHEVEKGVRRKKDIAAEFGIPANTLSTIMKNKDKIASAIQESRFSSERKRFKSSSYPQLEEAMFKWVKCMRDKNIQLQGSILREKAHKFAEELGIESFQASTGWLDKFKHRNGIVQKVMSGESASVSEVDCEDYRRDVLPTLLADYDPRDVFNADETGLFFKCLPEKTLAFKGETCHGGKRSKERVTVMVAANMTGTEKLKLLVIGKSAKPRCFSGVKSLPVDYQNNKKAWMTSEIYESWLNKLDKKFLREKRKILLFVDNCPSHPKVTGNLQAIRVVFLPPNMTSKLQPLDQGVIKNLKHHYRKKCVQRLLRNVETGKQLNDINLLDAVVMLQKSWDDVTEKTIANCFRKAGFVKTEFEFQEQEDLDEPVPEEWSDYQNVLSCEEDYDSFINVDAHVLITDHPTDSEILGTVTVQQDGSEEEDVDITNNEMPLSKEVPTGEQALDILATFRRYVQGQPSVEEDVFQAVNLLENFVENRVLQKRKQKKLTDFFSKI